MSTFYGGEQLADIVTVDVNQIPTSSTGTINIYTIPAGYYGFMEVIYFAANNTNGTNQEVVVTIDGEAAFIETPFSPSVDNRFNIFSDSAGLAFNNGFEVKHYPLTQSKAHGLNEGGRYYLDWSGVLVGGEFTLRAIVFLYKKP